MANFFLNESCQWQLEQREKSPEVTTTTTKYLESENHTNDDVERKREKIDSMEEKSSKFDNTMGNAGLEKQIETLLMDLEKSNETLDETTMSIIQRVVQEVNDITAISTETPSHSCRVFGAISRKTSLPWSTVVSISIPCPLTDVNKKYGILYAVRNGLHEKRLCRGDNLIKPEVFDSAVVMRGMKSRFFIGLKFDFTFHDHNSIKKVLHKNDFYANLTKEFHSVSKLLKLYYQLFLCGGDTIPELDNNYPSDFYFDCLVSHVHDSYPYKKKKAEPIERIMYLLKNCLSFIMKIEMHKKCVRDLSTKEFHPFSFSERGVYDSYKFQDRFYHVENEEEYFLSTFKTEFGFFLEQVEKNVEIEGYEVRSLEDHWNTINKNSQLKWKCEVQGEKMCCVCGKLYKKNKFSKNQLRKNHSKCKKCNKQ